MIYDSSVGSHLVMFNLFGELWVSFRGTQVRDFRKGFLKIFSHRIIEEYSPKNPS